MVLLPHDTHARATILTESHCRRRHWQRAWLVLASWAWLPGSSWCRLPLAQPCLRTS